MPPCLYICCWGLNLGSWHSFPFLNILYKTLWIFGGFASDVALRTPYILRIPPHPKCQHNITMAIDGTSNNASEYITSFDSDVDNGDHPLAYNEVSINEGLQ